MRAAPGVENDLLEARFHVANAAALSAATGDRHRTKTELDRADKCLQKAIGVVGEDFRPFVSAVRGELTQAKRELDMADPDTDTRDEQIKIDLDAVLQALHGHWPTAIWSDQRAAESIMRDNSSLSSGDS